MWAWHSPIASRDAYSEMAGGSGRSDVTGDGCGDRPRGACFGPTDSEHNSNGEAVWASSNPDGHIADSGDGPANHDVRSS